MTDAAPAPGCSSDCETAASPVGWDWFRWSFLAVVLLGGAVLMAQNQADADLWGHVQYGRDALQYGLPADSTYTYTAEGYRWINHENLAEVAFAWGVDTIGILGVLAVKCLLSVLLLGLLAWRAVQRGVGLVALSVTLLLVALCLAPWWSVRPQLLSFVWATLLLVLLDYCFSAWQEQWHLPWFREAACASPRQELRYNLADLAWLWLAAPLMVLWTNSHAGFAIGCCLFGAYLACRAFEAWCVRGSDSTGLILRLLLMIGACLLATCLNPYGPNLHRWLLNALLASRPEITEWNALDPFSVPAIPYLCLIAVLLVATVTSKQPRDFTHLVLIACVLWQAIAHERHIAFLALLFGFWMPTHVQSALERFWPGEAEEDPAQKAQESPAARWLLAGGVALGALLLAGRLAWRLTDLPVPRSEWPVAAFQYIEDRGLRGKLVCSFNWAQYALAAFGAPRGQGTDGLRLHFDGRCCTCYPQEVIDMHFDWVLGDGGPWGRYRDAKSGPLDGSRVLEYQSPDLVLANRKQPHSTEILARHTDRWVLLYQDATSQLWGRRSKYDDPASRDYIPPAARHVSDAPQLGSVTWPALPAKRRVIADAESERVVGAAAESDRPPPGRGPGA